MTLGIQNVDDLVRVDSFLDMWTPWVERRSAGRQAWRQGLVFPELPRWLSLYDLTHSSENYECNLDACQSFKHSRNKQGIILYLIVFLSVKRLGLSFRCHIHKSYKNNSDRLGERNPHPKIKPQEEVCGSNPGPSHVNALYISHNLCKDSFILPLARLVAVTGCRGMPCSD